MIYIDLILAVWDYQMAVNTALHIRTLVYPNSQKRQVDYQCVAAHQQQISGNQLSAQAQQYGQSLNNELSK